ncbi:MAG: hypothetical protein HY355_01985 [Armatimonadetes bacterium]|nr:hypothetical protein [Armatimonadota bacterium]
MRRLTLALIVCLSLVSGGCQILRRSEVTRPTAGQVAGMLPKDVTIKEVAYADLDGDGREEVLVAAARAARAQPIAFVLAPDDRGRYRPVLQRFVAGDGWLPVQTGRAGDNAPLVAVFAARGGSAGALSYIVVQHAQGGVQVTLEHSALIAGRIQFVPEGLLETAGDLDRLFRWSEGRWQAEDLFSQYLPPLPQGAVTIQYTVDPIRGPFIEGPRSMRLRVGQRIFFRRMDRGEPSRILFSGGARSLSVGPDGIVSLLQPDQIEITIEGPAYSGRTLTLSVRVDQ